MNVPVLLLPGWGDDARALRRMVRHLLDHGWTSPAIEAAGYVDPIGSNITHADEIAIALDRLIQRTSVPHVDVVAHSMSGLALRWFLAHAGEACGVRRAIFVATPHHGTWLAHAARGEGAREMRPGSPFLQQLRALQLPPALRTFTVRTLLETHVFPHRSAILQGASDHLVRSIVHARMLHSQRVLRIVRSCLTDPA